MAALQLAHAVAHDAVLSVEGRPLLIKGIASAQLGLRPLWSSADVDLLVPLADVDRVSAALRARGWQPRAADADTFAFPRHSDSYFHARWPCDIDLHFRFPGFEADPAEIFELLWDRRRPRRVADRTIWIPDPLDSLLIAALHALRSHTGAAFDRRTLTRFERLVVAAGPDRVIARARETHALACLRPLLEPIANQTAIEVHEWGEPSLEWRLRQLDPLARRLVIATRLHGRGRLRALRLALAPPVSTLFKDVPGGAPPDLAQRACALLRRWARGIRLLIPATRQAWGFLRAEQTAAASRSYRRLTSPR